MHTKRSGKMKLIGLSKNPSRSRRRMLRLIGGTVRSTKEGAASRLKFRRKAIWVRSCKYKRRRMTKIIKRTKHQFQLQQTKIQSTICSATSSHLMKTERLTMKKATVRMRTQRNLLIERLVSIEPTSLA